MDYRRKKCYNPNEATLKFHSMKEENEDGKKSVSIGRGSGGGPHDYGLRRQQVHCGDVEQ